MQVAYGNKAQDKGIDNEDKAVEDGEDPKNYEEQVHSWGEQDY